ncbi:HAD family hydrolase [Nocardioides sp. KC13]|uniref:HAD family hydrolase n=1 Tax=Nocardioides turkmenicus TaxID=2711220 RepID=A0A6M1R7A0_9ACTN|nr:HAD family hydrolase [Nocardioides sp. KC13]NGN96030.1 HAD family hydrolase [Nocardioides sp. KC13]
MPRPVLVLDLDGTVCLGDTPALLYATRVAALTDAPEALLETAQAFLGQRLPQSAPKTLMGAQDGYEAVKILGLAAGVTEEELSAAYVASRAEMSANPGDIHTPEGLVDLLAGIDAYRVILTNSPGSGLDEVLEHLGVRDVVDEVRTDALKPTRMTGHLDAFLDTVGAADTPEWLMSVGDIWRNDLAPAVERGCVAAYVDAFDRRQGPAHVRAGSFRDLYSAVLDWSNDPSSFLAAHPLKESVQC